MSLCFQCDDMRCTYHRLQSGNFHLDLCEPRTGQLRQRSLPSIVTIGGTPKQMKVSFAPKSVENFSRLSTEMPSAVWSERHEHPDCPVFQLVWPKSKTTLHSASLTVPPFIRDKQTQRLEAQQQALKVCPVPS